MVKLTVHALFGLIMSAVVYDLKIVGGKDAVAGQFPYQIALKRSGSFTCSGSIISPAYILTAAHCVVDSSNRPYPASQFTVIAGILNYNTGGITGTVKTVISHRSYGNFQNDIALLELTSALTYTSLIQPIALANTDPPIGSEVITSGWGRLLTRSVFSTILQFSISTVAPFNSCSVSSGLYNGFLCLSHSSGNGAWSGDSGGPATYNNKLVGVANFVIGECDTTYPDGYAKVSYFLNWIIANMV